MSFLAVRAAINTRLRTITGIKAVVSGMPESIQNPPLFITQFESGVRVGQTNAHNWRFMLHCIIQNQGNQVGEDAIDGFVDATMQAFSIKLLDGNGQNRARLGGVAEQCWFEDVRSGDSDGYINFGNPAVLYRRIAFVLMVKTLEAY
jgi:hypothetical protein